MGLHDDARSVPHDAAGDPSVVEAPETVAQPTSLDRPDGVEVGGENEGCSESTVMAVRGGHLVRPVRVGVDDLGSVPIEGLGEASEKGVVELARERPHRQAMDRSPRRPLLARNAGSEAFHGGELPIEIARVDVDRMAPGAEARSDLGDVLFHSAGRGRVARRELGDLHGESVALPLLDGPVGGFRGVGTVRRAFASRRGAGRTSCTPRSRARPTRPSRTRSPGARAPLPPRRR